MYVYWFNSRKGNELLGSEVTDIRYHRDHMSVSFNKTSELAKRLNKTWLNVPFEEGKIGYGHFWLEEENELKALDIVNDYEKSKWLKTIE